MYLREYENPDTAIYLQNESGDSPDASIIKLEDLPGEYPNGFTMGTLSMENCTSGMGYSPSHGFIEETTSSIGRNSTGTEGEIPQGRLGTPQSYNDDSSFR